MSPTKADVENTLVAQPDVAAGLVNAVFAKGAAFARPTELENAPLSGTYESTVGLRGTMRDVAKYFIRDEKLECIFAFEVQSSPHPFMPARVLGYDGITYRDQLENQTLRERFRIGVNRIAPVFTIILYVGAEQWRKNRKLSDRATMSQDVARVLAPYFDDYEIRVVDLAGMSDEELEKFPNDIRIIAEYFRAMRNKTEYKPSRIKIVHQRELFYFMEHVVGDRSFAYDVVMQGYEKEPEDMCEVLDRMETKWRLDERRKANAEFQNEREKFEDEREKFEDEREKFEDEREKFEDEREKFRDEREKLIMKLKKTARKLSTEGRSDEAIAEFLDVDVADVKIWLDSESQFD